MSIFNRQEQKLNEKLLCVCVQHLDVNSLPATEFTHISTTFKCQFLTNRNRNWMKNCCESMILFIPFLSCPFPVRQRVRVHACEHVCNAGLAVCFFVIWIACSHCCFSFVLVMSQHGCSLSLNPLQCLRSHFKNISLLLHYALLLTPTCWKSSNTNARAMAFVLSLALNPTTGIHSHKTLDTAQPRHLLKPKLKTFRFSQYFHTNYNQYPVSATVTVCACVCFHTIPYVNCFGRTMLYVCIAYHI